MTSVVFTGEIFLEGDHHVGLCRELDVSSFGDSPEDAMASLQEAVVTFLEGCVSCWDSDRCYGGVGLRDGRRRCVAAA